MFALFFSLYLAMFTGQWHLFASYEITSLMKTTTNGLGTFVTSIFNETATFDTLGDILTNTISGFGYAPYYLSLVSFILALITSIGIVVMAVKGVKKAFGIFFMGIRNI